MTELATSTSVGLPLHGRGAHEQPAAAYVVRLRRLVRERWRAFAVFSATMLVVDLLHFWVVVSGIGLAFTDALESGRWMALYVPTMVVAVFVALVASEALALRGAWHALATVVTLVAGVAAALAVLAWSQGGVLNPSAVMQRQVVSDAAFAAREAWLYFASGVLLAAVFAGREREARLARLAREAELERAQAERRTMASRLKVLQARVEPELLFGVLSDVRRRYEHEPAAAEWLLESLIAYLRAALPQLRGEASTLEREVALAASYLELSAAWRAGDLELVSRLRAADLDQGFPPMVLLPLVRHAIGQGATRLVAEALSAPGERACALAIHAAAGRRPLQWHRDALDPVEATLKLFYGADASLAVGGSRIVLHWTKADDGPRGEPPPPAEAVGRTSE